jgi:16S rRNA (guanine527-N7)-methyltransferase
VTAALDALASGAASILGRSLTAIELGSFRKYLKLLQKWQKSQRLIGSPDEGWIVENLFLDSLLFLRALPEDVLSLADIGSGAGLPGIPIKIVRNNIRVSLIESRAKRASFLSAAVRELGLQDIQVIAGRVEQYADEARGAFDAAVMRCAGDFSDTVQLAAPLVGRGGLIVASGPPTPRPLKMGSWVEVPGVRSGTSRRFAVFRAEG